MGSKQPIAPALFRVRPDLTWQDVAYNFKVQKGRPPGNSYVSASDLTGCIALPVLRGMGKQKPKGYWLRSENRRDFFTKFAAEKGFEPTIPENWKNVTNSQILCREVPGLSDGIRL